jgi:nucleoid-associated protein YgaU
MSRFGNSTVAPPVAVASELTGAAAVPSISRDGEQYAVQPNDSYWTISEKAYGTGAFFKALYQYNRKKRKDADDLHVGQTLLVPDENVLRRSYPDLCPKPRRNIASVQQRMVSASSRLRGPGKVYTVVDGDTLFEIARHELGKPSRWGEIYELNRDILGDDFDYLRAGTELILPSTESKPRSETAVRPPEAIYPR